MRSLRILQMHCQTDAAAYDPPDNHTLTRDDRQSQWEITKLFLSRR